MSVKDLQAKIIAEDGLILSTDTLNLQHLLPAAYDLIQAFCLSPELAEAIKNVFVGEEPTFYNQFYGRTQLDNNKYEEASYLFDEVIYNLFNEIAPDGFYFGNTDGDGSCFGFFRYESL